MTFPVSATFSGGSAPATVSFPATITFPAQGEGPEVPAFDQEVADEAARLSLTGISVGWKVHQVDNDTIYQYNGPNSAVGGMFVAGADGESVLVNGIYADQGVNEGKRYYNILGITLSNNISAVVWVNPEPLSGVLPGWVIYDSSGGEKYYSLEDVATPDLVTVWVPAIADASPTVTPVTQGELVAGATVEGAGSGDDNGVITNQEATTSGRFDYTGVEGVLTSAGYIPLAHGDPNKWSIAGGHYTIESTAAFPWGLIYDVVGGDPPAPTVTRNDVAAASNWTEVP